MKKLLAKKTSLMGHLFIIQMLKFPLMKLPSSNFTMEMISLPTLSTKKLR